MDPLSAVASIAALVEVTRAVQILFDLTIKQFNSVEPDIRQLKQDIRTFRHTLDELYMTLEGATPNLDLVLLERNPLHSAIRSSKTTFLQLDTLLKQLFRDKIVLQYPPGRPPRRLSKIINVLRRIRGETDCLNKCLRVLQAIPSLSCAPATRLPTDTMKTDSVLGHNMERMVAVQPDDDVLTPSAQSSKANRILEGRKVSFVLKCFDDERSQYDFEALNLLPLLNEEMNIQLVLGDGWIKCGMNPSENVHTRTRVPQYNGDNEAAFTALPKHYRYSDRPPVPRWIKQDGQGSTLGPHTSGNGQEKRVDSKMWLRKVGMYSPLVLAIIGSYLMGQYEPPSGQSKYAKDEFHILPVVDTVLTPRTLTAMSLPILIVAMATTSFSLTAQHYILTLENRDRDMVILTIVGTGVIAGMATGLDGMAILLRVAPWCAIAAFFLCGFVLPPIEGRRSTLTGTLPAWASTEEKGQKSDMASQRFHDQDCADEKVGTTGETDMQDNNVASLV